MAKIDNSKYQLPSRAQVDDQMSDNPELLDAADEHFRDGSKAMHDLLKAKALGSAMWHAVGADSGFDPAHGDLVLGELLRRIDRAYDRMDRQEAASHRLFVRAFGQ